MKTYIYARKKHPFTSYPAAKHPNTANFRLQTYDKNQWTFLCNTGVDFSSRNKSANLKVSFQKFLSVQSIIPCWTHLLNCGYGMKHSYRYLLGQVPAFVFCYSFDFFCLLKTRLKYAKQVGFLVFVSFVLVL